VLVPKSNAHLDGCKNVYTQEEYIKQTNTLSQFNAEVTHQKDIYVKTSGRNGIAICPRIFDNIIFDNIDAIEFLEFFNKNVSDIESTYVVNFLLDKLRENNEYGLGLIVMEYIKLRDDDTESKDKTKKRSIRDDRIKLYTILTTPKRVPSGETETIVSKLTTILPTLHINPDILYNEEIKENVSSTSDDPYKTLQLEYLKLNYYKYRIIAHVIYYMLRAFQAGYVHEDLHSNNIFVVNIYKKRNTYHGCLHPFSLNDVGIDELGNIGKKQKEYFKESQEIKKSSDTQCNITKNYCNISCIQIIDWGRTTKISNLTTKTNEMDENNENDFEISIEEIFDSVNILKEIYKSHSYIFNNVGLNTDVTILNDLELPQFYIIWLIWNEYKKKLEAAKLKGDNELNTELNTLKEEYKNLKDRIKIFKEQPQESQESQESQEELPKLLQENEHKIIDFYEFLTLFKTNCEYNAFYETIDY
jgi:hypothetical protein